MKIKAKIISASLLLCLSCISAKAEVSFSGNSSEVIAIDAEKNTGLNRIYVARTVQGLSITALPMNGKAATSWQQYDNRGGGFAVDVEGVRQEGLNLVLDNPKGDTGYLLTYPDGTYYFWLTDYSAHPLQMQSLELPTEQDCSMIALTLTGQGDAIHYYSINGRQLTLDRNIKVSFNTLEWNSEELQWKQKQAEELTQNVGQLFISPAPLCNTTFTATGDRFLEAWDAQQTIESTTWDCTVVAVNTTAERTNKPGEGSNQMGAGQDSGELGGSAPADVSFKAYITDAVLHSEWQFATDAQFEDITHRFNQQDLDYTFTEEGTVYVRFVGSNFDGSCTAESDVYTVSIGASDLKIPNAFSPGASEGVNDIWKVSYKSLLEFKCWIFNRYGTQLFYFDNPEDGWDGKYNGKLVPPGVYFYVIEAKGSDGKQYKKGGDINILRYNPNGRNNGGSGGGGTTE